MAIVVRAGSLMIAGETTLSDPDVERQDAANDERAAKKEDAEHETGVIGTIDRAFSFRRDKDVDPEDPEDIERRRRANDEAAR
jgi:hypothetical protein